MNDPTPFTANSDDSFPALQRQLRGATTTPGAVDIDQLWTKGRRARTRQRVGAAFGCVALVAALGFGASQLVPTEASEPVVTAGTGTVEDAEAIPRDQGPQFGDHWYSAFGISVCGNFEPDLMSTIDETGIHSHQDGVIHIHPWFEEFSGENATMGLFFESMQITVTDESITFPDGSVLSVDSARVREACGADSVSLDLVRWPTLDDRQDPEIITQDFGSARLLNDQEGLVLTFSPVDGDRMDVLPPSALTIGTLATQPPQNQTPAEDFDQFRRDLLQLLATDVGPVVSTPPGDQSNPMTFPLTESALAEAQANGLKIAVHIERGSSMGWLSTRQLHDITDGGVGVMIDENGTFDVCCDEAADGVTPPAFTDADIARYVRDLTAALLPPG